MRITGKRATLEEEFDDAKTIHSRYLGMMTRSIYNKVCGISTEKKAPVKKEEPKKLNPAKTNGGTPTAVRKTREVLIEKAKRTAKSCYHRKQSPMIEKPAKKAAKVPAKKPKRNNSPQAEVRERLEIPMKKRLVRGKWTNRMLAWEKVPIIL
jgi:hypothetical protein